jgi:hypothetical protein
MSSSRSSKDSSNKLRVLSVRDKLQLGDKLKSLLLALSRQASKLNNSLAHSDSKPEELLSLVNNSSNHNLLLDSSSLSHSLEEFNNNSLLRLHLVSQVELNLSLEPNPLELLHFLVNNSSLSSQYSDKPSSHRHLLSVQPSHSSEVVVVVQPHKHSPYSVVLVVVHPHSEVELNSNQVQAQHCSGNNLVRVLAGCLVRRLPLEAEACLVGRV